MSDDEKFPLSQRTRWPPVGGYPSVEEQVEEQRRATKDYENNPPIYAQVGDAAISISLRDWFAWQALSAILTHYTTDTHKFDASLVYEVVDKMLEARKR